MRLASFVGAVALSCAVFFLFYRFWGGLTVAAQVGILTVGPILLLLTTHLLHGWEKTGYFATLAALAACAAFVLDLSALGSIYNLAPTPHAFLAWGVFALLVGWDYGLRLPHFFGLVCVGLWLTALPGTLHGEELPDLFSRGESLILVGLLFLGLPKFLLPVPLRWPVDIRVVGMLGLFLGLFILSVAGQRSWLPFEHYQVENLYQILGFALTGLVIAWGVRDRHTELVNGGMIFLTVLCLVKAVDWWWDWMPRWLFFLVLAAFAIGVMVALKRVRLVLARRNA